MMVNYLGAKLEDTLKELEDTIGCHAIFGFLESQYTHHLAATMHVEGDSEHVMYHRACALRSYLLYLVGSSIFMDRSDYYLDVAYLRYFTDLKQIYEYNYGATCLIYLYSKLAEGCLWKTKKMIAICVLFSWHLCYAITNNSSVPFLGMDPLSLPTHLWLIICWWIH